jgi:hypothetical protein
MPQSAETEGRTSRRVTITVVVDISRFLMTTVAVIGLVTAISSFVPFFEWVQALVGAYSDLIPLPPDSRDAVGFALLGVGVIASIVLRTVKWTRAKSNSDGDPE